MLIYQNLGVDFCAPKSSYLPQKCPELPPAQKNSWQKALRRDTVFPWTKSLAIYFNILFRQGLLFEEAIYSKIEIDKD